MLCASSSKCLCLTVITVQSFENLSVESGGSGPEKNDPPGRMKHCNTQLLYSDAALSKYEENNSFTFY